MDPSVTAAAAKLSNVVAVTRDETVSRMQTSKQEESDNIVDWPNVDS